MACRNRRLLSCSVYKQVINKPLPVAHSVGCLLDDSQRRRGSDFALFEPALQQVKQERDFARQRQRQSESLAVTGAQLLMHRREIAKLEIGDFDWRAGTVTLKRTKSQRQDVLPLPVLTGQALAEYMRHERPATTLPSLFVRRLAPHDKPIGVDAVSQAIGRALRGAGISRGCHSLRHTLACRLVNSGSSIKEVADVLRHRSLDTSLIYAKLDLQLLAEVALPWPGSAS